MHDELRAMAFNCRIRRSERHLFWWRVAAILLASALAAALVQLAR